MGTIHNLSPHSVHTAITRIEYCGTQYAARITRGSLRAMGTRVYEHTHHTPGHQRATHAWSSTRDVRAVINARRDARGHQRARHARSSTRVACVYITREGGGRPWAGRCMHINTESHTHRSEFQAKSLSIIAVFNSCNE